MPASISASKSGDDRRTITCLYCHKEQEVGLRAMSITCRFCNKALKVEPVAVTHYEAKRQFATCGVLTVEKKGTIVTELILCGGLVVQGKVKGKIESQGLVTFGRGAEVKGDVTAPTLAVAAGAVLEGRYSIGWKRVEAPAA